MGFAVSHRSVSPSQRYHQPRGQRHKSLPQWAGQFIGLMHRWLPGRELVVVTDSSYAVIELLKQVSATPAVSLISRLRLDAAVAIMGFTSHQYLTASLSHHCPP